MIKDFLKNSKNYYGLSENIKKGFSWLETNNLENLPDGKYNIASEEVFATIQTYETREEAKYENHRKYIDIQYMIKGSENIGVTDISNCTSCVEYNEEKDIEFYNINIEEEEEEEEYVELKTGQFLVLYPQDAHKPSMTRKKKDNVKKVVVKVLLK